METIKINHDDVMRFYTLNTWTDEIKAKIREALEAGMWVHLGSTAIGHTAANYTEWKGLEWLKEEYGDRLQISELESWGETVARIK